MATAQAGWTNRIVGHGEEAPDQLLANPQNWRVHPKAQQDALSGLLDRVGWVQDVIVNQRTGHVVDGHLRVSLAISRQEPSIPVVYVDLSPEEEALVLASLDPLSAMAGSDKDMLAQLIADVAVDGPLGDLLAELTDGAKRPRNTDPNALPVQVPTRAKTGDLWLLGDHRLLCGDSMLQADVARLMGDDKAAVMWTDPPYGVKYVGGTKDALQIENDEPDTLDDLLCSALRNATEALEPGAPFYIARPPGPLSLRFGLAIVAEGWRLHQEIVWVKDAIVLGHSDYHYRHETILFGWTPDHETLVYGWTPGPGRSGRGKHEGSRWYGDNAQSSVLQIPRPKASREHPTMKPVELVERCLQNSSRPAAIVYEPFCGSGSTLIAADNLRRRCYAIELDPRYVDVTVRRWEEYTGREAVRDG